MGKDYQEVFDQQAREIAEREARGLPTDLPTLNAMKVLGQAEDESAQ